MRSNLSGLVVAALALVAAPAALACEDPDNIYYVLRSASPASVGPGEFVLQVDVASRRDVTEAPTIYKIGDNEFQLSNTFAVYDVMRVHSGSFADTQVRIPTMMTSCTGFATAEDASYFVGHWRVEPDGGRALMVKSITRGELLAEQPANQKAAN